MQQPTVQEHLRSYWQWRMRVAAAIKELGGWLAVNRCATRASSTCIDAALAAMRADRLNVAFVSGGGREKSALIEGLFRDEGGHHLLPAYPGFATTCTTELYWDPECEGPYLRLLPIETQGLGIPFTCLRAERGYWVQYPLNPQDPAQTASRLREIAETKTVSHAEAVTLGLPAAQDRPWPASGMAEIPKWRHAIVSFPSPLLRLGLAVLDIPNLAPSEVAASLVGQAQVVVWVLTADEVIEQGDAELVCRHVREAGSGHQERLIVALNRVDPRLDPVEDLAEIRQVTQRRLAAALGIAAAEVFPVSAQTALVARIRGDQALLHRTGIETLEARILTGLLQAKQQAHIDGLQSGLNRVLEEHRARIGAGLDRAKKRLGQMEAYRVKCNPLILEMLDRTRHEQELYLRAVQRFQESQERLTHATERCRDILDPRKLDTLFARVHSDMARSWTTAGIAAAMKDLFDELVRAMQAITAETEHTRKLVRAIYDGFEHDFGFALTTPKVFAPRNFRVEIELLHREVDAFRRSPTLALAEQGAVIKRFNEEMVSRARSLFEQLRAAFDTWGRDTLDPLAQRIQEHKSATEQRLGHLRRLARSHDDTGRHLEETQAQYAELARQLTALRNIHNTLSYELSSAGTTDTNVSQTARESRCVV
jgi:hypothetical protein